MNNDNLPKFKKLLDFAFNNQYSDFYRRKYEKANFNPAADFNSIEDVRKIPLLSKKELSETDPKELLFIKEDEGCYVSVTSGTTGEPFFIFRSGDIPLRDSETFGKSLLLFNPRLTAKAFARRALNRYKGGPFLVGDIYNLPGSCHLAAKLGINTIITTPTLAIILKDYIERYPNLKKTLKSFLLSGEFVSQEKKKILEELYPHLKFSFIYGMAEIGHITYQCQFLIERKEQIYYHPETNYYYFEIINSDTGKEVKLGEKGELVITSFESLATPIIRYKTGDSAIFKENDCPCGSAGPLLQILGRIDYDAVKVGGFVLKKQMMEKPISSFKEILEGSFEAHIYERYVNTKPRIKVMLNLALKTGLEESLDIKQKVENEFLENWQLSPNLNLRKAVEAGLFEPLQINFVDFPTTGKAKQVLILH
jgi:phenylacetate-CoA ligase